MPHSCCKHRVTQIGFRCFSLCLFCVLRYGPRTIKAFDFFGNPVDLYFLRGIRLVSVSILKKQHHLLIFRRIAGAQLHACEFKLLAVIVTPLRGKKPTRGICLFSWPWEQRDTKTNCFKKKRHDGVSYCLTGDDCDGEGLDWGIENKGSPERLRGAFGIDWIPRGCLVVRKLMTGESDKSEKWSRKIQIPPPPLPVHCAQGAKKAD